MQKRWTDWYIHCTVNLGEITVGDHLWWLVADTNLEASWAPIDELNGSLGLESGNSLVNILGHNITTVQQASGHVLSVLGVALDHLVVGLEASSRDLLNTVGLVRSLSSGHDWCIGN